MPWRGSRWHHSSCSCSCSIVSSIDADVASVGIAHAALLFAG